MTQLSQNIYKLLSRVPKGRVTTYKALAQALNTRAYRAIGQILKHNPSAPSIPCHRVVRSDGSIGGFMGKTTGPEIRKKIALLKSEGVEIQQGKVKDFRRVLYKYV